MGRKIGYYQLFSWEDRQQEMKDTLAELGCDLVFNDTIDKSKQARPGFLDSLEAIRPQDTILIPELHMLGPDFEGWLKSIFEVQKKGGIVTLLDSGLTLKDGDVMSLFTSSAFRAKDRLFRLGKGAGGSKGGSGRKRTMTKQDEERLFQTFNAGEYDTKFLAKKFGISTSTVNRILRRKREEEEPSES